MFLAHSVNSDEPDSDDYRQQSLLSKKFSDDYKRYNPYKQVKQQQKKHINWALKRK